MQILSEIITIGDEILRGEVVNGNAAVIGRALADIGVPAKWGDVVADEQGEIQDAVRRALTRAHVIILTGGLGPTPDDLTMDALADLFGLEIREDPVLLAHVEAFFQARGIKMPVTSRNQARFPVGAIQVPNPMGTATGILIEQEGRLVFSLPGVHAETKRMLAESVVPHVREAFPSAMVRAKQLRLADTGESQLLARITDLATVEQNVKLAFLPHHGLLDLRMIARASDPYEADMQIATAEAILREAADHKVYAVGDAPLAAVLGNILMNRSQRLAVAESCTGGLLMNMLTEIPGSSRWFERGVVTYSNEAKQEQLGIDRALIEAHGAVSEPVVRAMAEGVRNVSKTEWGVGITGVAGPDGGSDDKPVGTVWIAISNARDTNSRLYRLAGERSLIRLRAVHGAMYMLWKRLMDELA
ncbi:competence/damage-inducible protein A [candidate division KSB1 bacterium]|nr:competence/damage-inducible protein A [candidate division KSB1 bacterium]